MKKLDNILIFSFIVIMLLLSFVYRAFIITYNTFFNIVLTFVLVTANILLVSETNKMRTAQIQPNVYVAAQPVDELNTIVELFIHNIGTGPAYNVEFIDVSDFQYSKDEFLRNVHLIRNKIDFLSPNQKMRIFMMHSNEVFVYNSKDPIELKIKYYNKNKKKFIIDYKIDFSSIINVKIIPKKKTLFEDLLLKSIRKHFFKFRNNFELFN